MAIELTTASIETLNCIRQILCVPYNDPSNVCHVTGGTTLGGCSNEACGCHSLILGGDNNVTTGTNSTIINGNCNAASGACSVVIGGFNNKACGSASFIGPGTSNTAIGSNSVILAGGNNVVCGCDSVALGSANTITGNYSVTIGANNSIAGNCSLAVGSANLITADHITVLGTGITGASAAGVYVDKLYANDLYYTASPYHNVGDEILTLNATVSSLQSLVGSQSASWDDASAYHETISPYMSTGAVSLRFTNVPTSSAGLVVGEVWADENGFLRIVLT